MNEHAQERTIAYAEPASANAPAAPMAAALRSVQAIIDSVGEFAWVVDAQCLLVACNASLRSYMARQFGTDMVPGVRSADVLSPGRAALFDAFYRRALSSGHFRDCWELADGRMIEVCFNPVLQDGAVVGVAAFAQDMTARSEAEQALRRSEAKFRAVLDNSHDGILFMDASGKITYRSPSYVNINGYTDEERVGHSAFETCHPDDLERVRALWADVLQRYGGSFTAEYRTRHKNGSWLWVETVVRNLVKTPSVGELVVATRDITERKLLEAERDRLREDLFQAQKMEAIGTLAGGVAHDFNNILGAVLGGLSLIEHDPSVRPAIAQEVRSLQAIVRRGADLAKQLLGFARRGTYDIKAVDLAQVADSTCSIFSRTRPDVVVEQQFEPGLPAVLVDQTQLQQVLLNLLVNAGHAMPGGGQVALRGNATTLDRAEAEAQGVSPGTFVRFVVRDTGVGIDAAVLPHIFEPFFTTRGPGEGTGLGLASVYGIVRAHGGIVRVESEVGVGTAFTILLPVSGDRPTPVQREAEAVPHEARGTVLVVDDEAPLRRVYARMLKSMGYDAMTAEGGREALALVHAHLSRITLVVLDLTMPGMSGAETFEAIRAVAPSLPILLASGYTADTQAKALLARGGDGFLQKPFDLSELRAKVAELHGKAR